MRERRCSLEGSDVMFFFSSRRRHTRLRRDWSSDVCSSDLNANLSVRVTDEFMEAVKKDAKWLTHWITDPDQVGDEYQARDLLKRMAECAWHCGDPGVQYDSTINKWHTCPNSGRINASNPCSEYMFLDNTA